MRLMAEVRRAVAENGLSALQEKLEGSFGSSETDDAVKGGEESVNAVDMD